VEGWSFQLKEVGRDEREMALDTHGEGRCVSSYTRQRLDSSRLVCSVKGEVALDSTRCFGLNAFIPPSRMASRVTYVWE
jgi:hypothetical protein